MEDLPLYKLVLIREFCMST